MGLGFRGLGFRVHYLRIATFGMRPCASQSFSLQANPGSLSLQPKPSNLNKAEAPSSALHSRFQLYDAQSRNPRIAVS